MTKKNCKNLTKRYKEGKPVENANSHYKESNATSVKSYLKFPSERWWGDLTQLHWFLSGEINL